MTLVVLWEDRMQAGTRPVEYGPHLFLAAALADRRVGTEVAGPVWYAEREELRRTVVPIPCKGIDKLIARSADSRLYARGASVLAIYDDDQVRRHLGLDQDRRRTTTERVNAELASRAGDHPRFMPRAIGNNLEELISELAPAADREHVDRKAAGGRAHRERDSIFQAFSGHGQREARSGLALRNPAWAAIIDAALAALNPPSAG